MTYTHEVRFAQVFISGALNGLRIDDLSILFCDAAAAQAFIREALAEPQRTACGDAPYRIADPYLHALEEHRQ